MLTADVAQLETMNDKMKEKHIYCISTWIQRWDAPLHLLKKWTQKFFYDDYEDFQKIFYSRPTPGFYL